MLLTSAMTLTDWTALTAVIVSLISACFTFLLVYHQYYKKEIKLIINIIRDDFKAGVHVSGSFVLSNSGNTEIMIYRIGFDIGEHRSPKPSLWKDHKTIIKPGEIQYFFFDAETDLLKNKGAKPDKITEESSYYNVRLFIHSIDHKGKIRRSIIPLYILEIFHSTIEIARSFNSKSDSKDILLFPFYNPKEVMNNIL